MVGAVQRDETLGNLGEKEVTRRGREEPVGRPHRARAPIGARGPEVEGEEGPRVAPQDPWDGLEQQQRGVQPHTSVLQQQRSTECIGPVLDAELPVHCRQLLRKEPSAHRRLVQHADLEVGVERAPRVHGEPDDRRQLLPAAGILPIRPNDVGHRWLRGTQGAAVVIEVPVPPEAARPRRAVARAGQEPVAADEAAALGPVRGVATAAAQPAAAFGTNRAGAVGVDRQGQPTAPGPQPEAVGASSSARQKKLVQPRRCRAVAVQASHLDGRPRLHENRGPHRLISIAVEVLRLTQADLRLGVLRAEGQDERSGRERRCHTQHATI
mmetsp:Transcript_138272/g.429846  ORF Transcript_138272/g.429846 Transcript_138272/m.429846 type:complete len:325 (-) Transcript_138272:4-978(-)